MKLSLSPNENVRNIPRLIRSLFLSSVSLFLFLSGIRGSIPRACETDRIDKPFYRRRKKGGRTGEDDRIKFPAARRGAVIRFCPRVDNVSKPMYSFTEIKDERVDD